MYLRNKKTFASTGPLLDGWQPLADLQHAGAEKLCLKAADNAEHVHKVGACGCQNASIGQHSGLLQITCRL